MEKIRILYAEGHDLILFTAKQLLEAEGWEVEVCRDGSAALSRLGSNENFDLLILADDLDGLSGAELIERVKRETRLHDGPIILFTAEHANGDHTSAGADARLSKPGGLKDLIQTCRRLLPRAAAMQEPTDGEPGEAAG